MHALLSHLVAGRTLSVEQAEQAFDDIMSGAATPAQIAALLSMLEMRGPTVDELTGAAMVMRRKVSAVTVPQGLRVIDTCGTGGDGSHTFNISTAAALVAAAAGRPRGVAVAKHGNRSVTSKSGSSQVLEALGVKLQVSPQTLTRCLDEAGLCFCFAPAHHPAMKHAAPVRADLGFRTIFNLLGPLTNPAGARHQLIGVFADNLTEPLANVLHRLGTSHAMVVHGHYPGVALDELSITGPTQISHLRDRQVFTYVLDATTLGIARPEGLPLRAQDPQQSAHMLRCVLDGQPGPARDIVALNAAAALVVADLAEDLGAGLTMARAAMDSGDARRVLENLVRITQADTGVPA